MESIRGRGLAEVPEKTEGNREMLRQGTRRVGQLDPAPPRYVSARKGLI